MSGIAKNTVPERRSPVITNIVRAFIACVVAFIVSYFAVTEIVKPVMRERGIFAHMNPVFTQQMLNAKVGGKSYGEIAKYLQRRFDESLFRAKIIRYDEMITGASSRYSNDSIKNKCVDRLRRGRAFWVGRLPFEGEKGSQEYDRSHDREYFVSDPYWRFSDIYKDDDLVSFGGYSSIADKFDDITIGYVIDYAADIMSYPLLTDSTLPQTVYAVLPIENTKYTVLAYHETSLSPVLPVSSIVFATALVLLILAIAVAIVFVPMLLRVRRIEDTCMLVAGGDFAARVGDLRHDSLGLLAQHIDKMTLSIERNFAYQKSLLQAVSHELRTPLSRIRFAIEMLDIDENDQKSMARLDSIDEDLNEIDGLLRELGYFNYVEAGKGRQNFEVNSVVDLVEATLKQRALALENFKVEVRGLDEDMIVEADSTAFKRVIGNLLSNAARYAKSRIDVNVSLSDDRKILEVAVEDDGPGIPEERRASVFEPFVCLDKSRSKSLGGVGLGLAIASRIMKIHRGTIEIETAEIGGARMVTRWPVYQEENTANPI